MVMWFYRATSLLTPFLFAEKRPRTPADFWKTQQGVKALAALAGLIILGFGMVFLIHLGGRFTRRYMNQSLRSPPADPDPEDWARETQHPNPKIGPDNVD